MEKNRSDGSSVRCGSVRCGGERGRCRSPSFCSGGTSGRNTNPFQTDFRATTVERTKKRDSAGPRGLGQSAGAGGVPSPRRRADGLVFDCVADHGAAGNPRSKNRRSEVGVREAPRSTRYARPKPAELCFLVQNREGGHSVGRIAPWSTST